MKSNYEDLTKLQVLSAKVDIVDYEANKAFLTLYVRIQTAKAALPTAPVELKFPIDSSDALFGHIEFITRQFLGKEKEV